MGLCHRVPASTMSRDKRNSLKSKLASAIAERKSSAAWSSANGVAERTAQRSAPVASSRGHPLTSIAGC
jgi:hypothetical protein